jgi:Multiubiquitin
MSDAKKTVTISVNTIDHEVLHEKISYASVVNLAFPGGAGSTYIVKYYRGNSDNLTGTLAPGTEIGVRNGMDFRVTGTGES